MIFMGTVGRCKGNDDGNGLEELFSVVVLHGVALSMAACKTRLMNEE